MVCVFPLHVGLSSNAQGIDSSRAEQSSSQRLYIRFLSVLPALPFTCHVDFFCCTKREYLTESSYHPMLICFKEEEEAKTNICSLIRKKKKLRFEVERIIFKIKILHMNKYKESNKALMEMAEFDINN